MIKLKPIFVSLLLLFPLLASAEESSVFGDAFFDRYRMHITESDFVVGHDDSYYATGMVTLDNGLKLLFRSNPQSRNSAAEIVCTYLKKKFYEGKEIAFGREKKWIDNELSPHIFQCVTVPDLEPVHLLTEDLKLETLPKINQVVSRKIRSSSSYSIQITLNDGTVWQANSSTEPDSFLEWEEGDRILVSLDSKKALFFNIDHNIEQLKSFSIDFDFFIGLYTSCEGFQFVGLAE